MLCPVSYIQCYAHAYSCVALRWDYTTPTSTTITHYDDITHDSYDHAMCALGLLLITRRLLSWHVTPNTAATTTTTTTTCLVAFIFTLYHIIIWYSITGCDASICILQCDAIIVTAETVQCSSAIFYSYIIYNIILCILEHIILPVYCDLWCRMYIYHVSILTHSHLSCHLS